GLVVADGARGARVDDDLAVAHAAADLVLALVLVRAVGLLGAVRDLRHLPGLDGRVRLVLVLDAVLGDAGLVRPRDGERLVRSARAERRVLLVLRLLVDVRRRVVEVAAAGRRLRVGRLRGRGLRGRRLPVRLRRLQRLGLNFVVVGEASHPPAHRNRRAAGNYLIFNSFD